MIVLGERANTMYSLCLLCLLLECARSETLESRCLT